MTKCELPIMKPPIRIGVETLFKRSQQKAVDAYFLKHFVKYMKKETDIPDVISDRLLQISENIYKFKKE